MLTLGGLFSGIGGFELAATWAGIKPIWSSEIDKSCCSKLRNNFNHKIIENDIRNIGKHNLEPTDIICGGDPCQPHSIAGMGKGTADERYLWPEMFRIIRELHPAFILNENVDGTIANGVLDIKIDDLESEGYTCQAYIIPAEAVGALHKRNRVWLVAYNPDYFINNRKTRKHDQTEIKKIISERDEIQHDWQPVDLWPADADAYGKRCEEQHITSGFKIFQEGLSRYFGFGAAPHGNILREVIKSGIVGMLNGLPEGLDYPDRNKRIAQMGNAIVPQVAYEFFRWMKTVKF